MTPRQYAALAALLLFVGLSGSTCHYRSALHAERQKHADEVRYAKSLIAHHTRHIAAQDSALATARQQQDGTTVVLRKAISKPRTAPPMLTISQDSGRYAVIIPPDTTSHPIPQPVASLIGAQRDYIRELLADQGKIIATVESHLAADSVERVAVNAALAARDSALVTQTVVIGAQQSRIASMERREKIATAAVVVIVGRFVVQSIAKSLRENR